MEHNQVNNSANTKLYLFFTAGITAVGGGQIYLRRKVNYLKKQGYTPFVFSYSYGECFIDDLKQFEPGIIPEIRFPVSAYSYRNQTKIKEKITDLLPTHFDSMVIESHEYYTATWGEFVAKNLNAKHIIYLLTEAPWRSPMEWSAFFLMKYKRNELFFITATVAQLFFEKYLNIKEKNPVKYSLTARYGSVVEDVADAKFGIKYDKNAYTVCSIGRLEKPFVYPMCCELQHFIKENPDKQFILVFAGGCRFKKKQKELEHLFFGIKNCSLYITGFLYPIPERLLKKCDVCISSSGSAITSARYGIPTISIDSQDYKPIGVLGYTTENSINRNNEEIRSLSEWLQDILFKKKYQKNWQPQKIADPDFSDHLDALGKINNLLYYEVNQLQVSSKTSLGACVLSMLKFKKQLFTIRTFFHKM